MNSSLEISISCAVYSQNIRNNPQNCSYCHGIISKTLVRHIMVPYCPQDVFFKAFQNALNIAKQNDATITVVKVVSYPMGLGLDVMTAVDAVSREYEIHKFEQIMSELQKEALAAEIKLDFQVIDLRLSPAKAFVEFASKNDADLMVVGSISERTWPRHFTSDISQEIMDLHPSCSVILVE